MKKFVLCGLALVTILASPGRAAAQISDAELARQVAEAIVTYSRFSIFDDVNLAIQNRAVTLTGRVTSPVKRDEIGKRIAKIDGIRSLDNKIGVLPVSQTDDRLRLIIADAIYNYPAFWRYAQLANPPIHIIVEHQHVTLTGVVASEVDRQLAYSRAQVGGTLGVENELRVNRQ